MNPILLQPNEHSIGETISMEEQISDKKRCIFETTLELIKDHGFHGCTMSLLAKDAKVAAGTIYHYFDSKDQLIQELFDYATMRLLSEIEEGDKEAPYKERFFTLLLSIHRFHVENPKVIIFFSQFINSPYFNEKKIVSDFDKRLFEFFKEGVEQGLLRQTDPKMLSVFISGSIISVLKVRQRFRTEFSDKELHELIQILWDGIAGKQEA